MKRTLLLVLLLAHSTWAAETAKLKLKHPSSFSVQPSDRNPFWPIGFKPSSKSSESAGPSIPPGSFAVTSITLDPGAHFAIINGKVMGEGQQFGLQISGQLAQLMVKRIEDGRVVLTHGGEEIVVPLRRK